jgi:hypothetical protein
MKENSATPVFMQVVYNVAETVGGKRGAARPFYVASG